MYILEFNDQQQQFHYNYIINGIAKSPENTYGWVTLSYFEDEYTRNLVCDFLDFQYLRRGIKLLNSEAVFITKNLVNLLKAYDKTITRIDFINQAKTMERYRHN